MSRQPGSSDGSPSSSFTSLLNSSGRLYLYVQEHVVVSRDAAPEAMTPWQTCAVMIAQASRENWAAVRDLLDRSSTAGYPTVLQGELAVLDAVTFHEERQVPDVPRSVDRLVHARRHVHALSRRAVGYDEEGLDEARPDEHRPVDRELAAEIRAMVAELSTGAAPPLPLEDRALIEAWARDRVLELSTIITEKLCVCFRLLENPEFAHNVAFQTLRFALVLIGVEHRLRDVRQLGRLATVDAARASWSALSTLLRVDADSAIQLGDLRQDPRYYQVAEVLFEAAAALADGRDEATHRKLLYQQAFALGKAGDPAGADRILAGLDDGTDLSVRYSRILAAWKTGGATDAARTQLKDLILELERTHLKDATGPQDVGRRKGAFPDKAYKLLLTIEAQRGVTGDTDDREIDEILRLVEVARSPGATLTYIHPLVHADDAAMDAMLSPLASLDGWVREQGDTGILLVQSGVDCTVFLTLRPGPEPLVRRVDVGWLDAPASADLGRRLPLVLNDELRSIVSDARPPSSAASEEVTSAARAAFACLPVNVHQLIRSVRHLLFVPDSFGGLSTLPLELLAGPGGWLGLTHTITRAPSITTLLRLVRAVPDPTAAPPTGACVVRADDPPGSDPLLAADLELDDVSRYLASLGLETRTVTGPRAAQFADALSRGNAVVHYIGHGRVTGPRSSIALTIDEEFSHEDIAALQDPQVRFVLVNSCAVGRSEYVGLGVQMGLAADLVTAGIPAVVAANHEVSDWIARDFSHHLYRAAADGAPWREALRTARQRLDAEPVNPVLWASYVLFADPRAGLVPRRRT